MQEHYYKFWRDLIKPKAFEVDRETFVRITGGLSFVLWNAAMA